MRLIQLRAPQAQQEVFRHQIFDLQESRSLKLGIPYLDNAVRIFSSTSLYTAALMSDLSKNLFSTLQPLQFADEIRLGSKHDGGYVVPRFSVVSSTTLISLGYGHDSKFERDFLKLSPNCHCSLYESQISFKSIGKNYLYAILQKVFKRRLIPKHHLRYLSLYFQMRLTPRLRYFHKEVRSKKTTSNQIAFSTVLNNLNPESNFFLKMDIEGGEYELLASLNIGNPQAMIIEFHDIHSRYSEFIGLIESIKTRYLVAHIHINNFAGNNDGVPKVIEITFVRKDIVPKATTLKFKKTIPTELDSPCNPKMADEIIDFESII
jgi:hypothetical protein